MRSLTLQDWKVLGEAIRERRTALELSHAELAMRAYLSERCVRDVELGRHPICMTAVFLLAQALDCDVSVRLRIRPRRPPKGHPPPVA